MTERPSQETPEPAPAREPSTTRRELLSRAAGSLSALPLLALGAATLQGAGCTAGPTLPPGTLVALASLPEGERVRVMHLEEPVELVRTGSTVRARSLFCTHTGCEVRWDSHRDLYQCLCHDGRFDPDGRVLFGPPTQPLRPIRTLPVGADKILLLTDLPAPATSG